MGAGVSEWRLANAVARCGQLGVVAGTALDIIMARRLQLGDPGGHMRRALAAFPVPGVAQRILDRYFLEGGKAADAPFRSKPMPNAVPSRALDELTVASNFVEVWLAKEGHSGMVGVNYLEKIQVPTLPCLFGAMLAGVSTVCMGAGIPLAIPGILDKLAKGLPVELKLDVMGAQEGEKFLTHFDPSDFMEGPAPMLERPKFLAIVSTAIVANVMLRKATGKVDGFVIEGPKAGGHNAPPRGRPALSEEGEPVYGKRDVPNLQEFRDYGIPFWLAGSNGNPGKLNEALAEGATGIQVGTAFAFSRESGFEAAWKEQILQLSREGKAEVFTDPVASPTGFPFKVIQVEGTISDNAVSKARNRVCDLGYLRHAYRRDNGKLGWRCPSEPEANYVKRGGDLENTVGRKCVCNGLLANLGMAQVRKDGTVELPMFTSGDDVANVARFLAPGETSYAAKDVVAYLLSEVSEIAAEPV
jgi:nitronate monooxygenase